MDKNVLLAEFDDFRRDVERFFKGLRSKFVLEIFKKVEDVQADQGLTGLAAREVVVNWIDEQEWSRWAKFMLVLMVEAAYLIVVKCPEWRAELEARLEKQAKTKEEL